MFSGKDLNNIEKPIFLTKVYWSNFFLKSVELLIPAPGA
jgi:hypothetical protein